MLFGKRLKELRKSKKMSQIELANLIGVTQATIANYEKDQRSPNIDTIIELSRLFEVSLPYLIGLSDAYDEMKIEHMNDIQCGDYFTDLLLNHARVKYELFSREYLELYGLEKLFLKLFRYALTKIGWLWEVGEITIGQEHQLSYRIDSLIENLTNESMKIDKDITILAMTIPGEKHTLGLKMLVKLLENKGYKCDYIGEGIPLEDYKRTIDKIKPDYIILSVTVPSQQDLDAYAQAGLSSKVILVGSGADDYASLDVEIINTYELCLEKFNAI